MTEPIYKMVLQDLRKVFARPPPASVMIAIGRACMRLEEYPDTHPAVSVPALDTFGSIIKRLPYHFLSDWETVTKATEHDQAGMTVPLYDIVDCGRAICDVFHPFCYDDRLINNGILASLRKQLLQNEANIHGLSLYEYRKKKIPLPHEMDEAPQILINKYLRNTPFYDFFCTQVPFQIPRDRWETHALILAPTEWGKSQLTGLFLREAIEDPQQRAVILLDPHGDLYRQAKERVPPERLVAIDPDENPPDLNILDYGVLSERAALDTFKFLMSSLAGGLSPKQTTSISHLFRLLTAIPDANLLTLHKIVSEQTKRPTLFAEPVSRLEEESRIFFETLWYSGNYQETRDALHWKLDAAIQEPTFKKMFSAKRNSIDLARFMDEKKVVLVKGGETSLGKEGMRLFLLFVIGQYYAAGKRRDHIPEHKRELAMMFVDEASYVLQAPIIADILKELRKYKCSFTAATQLWFDVGAEVRPAVMGNTGTFLFGKLAADEAKSVAPNIDAKPELLRSLRNVPRSHAEWCVYVRSVTDKAVVVTAPYGVLEAMPKIDRPLPTDPANSPLNELRATDLPLPIPTPSSAGAHKPPASEPLIKPGKEWE